MDCLNLNENVCRICLENNVILNWNDEIFTSYGMTYKDCYHKYTDINESDSNFYPTNLCKNCANGLKNAHMLFEKALESFNILRIALTDSKYILPDENTLIRIKDDMCLPPVHVNKIITETHQTNSVNDCEEICAVEPAHFVDITNFGPLSETLLEQQLVEIDSTESTNKETTNKGKQSETFLNPSLGRVGNKREKCKPLSNTSSENLIICPDYQLPNASANRKGNRRKKLVCEGLLEPVNIKSCVGKSAVLKLIKNRKREKLCQYCSLKVDETHIKQHEATHSENRERTEICPQCGLKMYSKDSLQGHMKVHIENRQKNQKCEFCEKAFFNKGSLNVHRRIHLGQMVACPICSKEYYRQIDVDKHLAIHSANPIQKSVKKVKYTIQCQYCKKNILTNSWKEHKAAHLNQPQTKCKICDKDFFSRASCKTHLRKVHRTREYDKFIYYHVDPNTRMSHLMMVQQEKVQPITK